LVPVNRLNDDGVGGLWICLVEHDTLVAGALQHGRERHDTNGRESHHPNAAILGVRLDRESVKLRVAHMDQADEHEDLQSDETMKLVHPGRSPSAV